MILPQPLQLMAPDFSSMNETDVREVIVRPLLARLGYAHGTQANIRTEVKLKYSKAFLGHKKPAKDVELSGRADYICEAVSYGRWVVEVKSPKDELTQDDVEQAHTYCAHPEISAHHFVLTNGREFRLYATSLLNAPILSWGFADTERHILTLYNILSYEAVRRRSSVLTPDVSKPLGVGLPSTVTIVGGHVQYGDHVSDHPLFNTNASTGMTVNVDGERVFRSADGLITAQLKLRSPFAWMAKINALSGVDGYEFSTSQEYISGSREHPSIFQNVINATVPKGVMVPLGLGLPSIPFPIELHMTAFTQAVGFVENERFLGVFEIDYHYVIVSNGKSGIPQLDQLIAQSPRRAYMKGGGEFDIRLKY